MALTIQCPGFTNNESRGFELEKFLDGRRKLFLVYGENAGN